jgi:hypothetical protein
MTTSKYHDSTNDALASSKTRWRRRSGVNWRTLTDVLRAEFESQDAMMTPFLESFVELEEVIDHSERNGVCSEKVAEAAQKELISLRRELDRLIVRKITLHRQFGVTEKASKQTR